MAPQGGAAGGGGHNRCMTAPFPALLAARLAALESGLLERGEAVRLALLAALAGEHVLLVGPPGTAKSALARRLHTAFDGARYFERLLTRFSVPEELFGPLSLKALEADRYERLVDGYLPTAGIAFLDEVFKANSAILNALLTLLNERVFDNGSSRVPVPLVCVVAASNEVPQDEALQAFHDRFLVRVPVAPIGDASFAALLELGETAPAADAPPITASERAELAAAACAVALPAEVLAALQAARAQCAARQIAVSDRRWRQTAGLLRTAAASSGRDTVEILDLWLLPHCLGGTPAQVAELQAWVEAELLGAQPVDTQAFERAVQAFEAQLRIERSAPAEARDAPDGQAGKMALARSLGGDSPPPGEADGLRLRAAARDASPPRRWGPLHVQARLAQLDALIAQATAEHAPLADRDARRAAEQARAPWLPPALAARLQAARRANAAAMAGLEARLADCRAGFAALPIDPDLAGPAPDALRWADDTAPAPRPPAQDAVQAAVAGLSQRAGTPVRA